VAEQKRPSEYLWLNMVLALAVIALGAAIKTLLFP
jgi:hypothetical protein